MPRLILTLAILSGCFATAACGQTREEIVRGDRQRVEAEGFWMYNDIPGAFAKAKQTGKPIVVVLRCLPCHECVKLDDELVDRHPVVRPLLENFVCVRQVSTNGLDLNIFQYDTDQSFAMFFLNADGTIYGRFGTRSHRTEWLGDVSLTGLARALEKVLEMHSRYDVYKASLKAKTGPPMEVRSPELYPSLKGKYTDRLNYEGDVVKSCIHCHQIGDAQREYYWHAGRPIPDEVLYPYPHPKVVGLIMNPNSLATVKDVIPATPAATAGFQPGDEIQTLNGQPLVSIADIQWVLHRSSPSGAVIPATVRRGDSTRDLELKVGPGWREASDLSWRVTTWGLRRIAAGGMVLEPADDNVRKSLDIPQKKMALLVKRTGRYGPHATARRKGIREGDIIVSYAGRTDLMTEQDVLTFVVRRMKAGDTAEIKILRKGRSLTFQLPIQR